MSCSVSGSGGRSLEGVLETIRPILRAAAIAGFSVGVLLFLLNPPSLSGAGGLVSLVVGALALVLVSAWGFVALLGRDAMPEDEFERLVRRTEELARHPRLAEEATGFELLVADAIDRLPPEFQALLETTPVVVSQRGAEHRAYGHYYGDTVSRENFEDRIVLYQDTLERDFGWDPDLLRAQVERTLRHELAHHLGWNEPGVRGLGL
jgi:predicted Zn-dependent protease with MMP-like domain